MSTTKVIFLIENRLIFFKEMLLLRLSKKTKIFFTISTYMLISQRSTIRSWLVVIVSALFFFYIFVQINLINSISGKLAQEFHLDARQLSSLFAYFAYGNLIFLFPAGIILDRFSVSRSLLISFIISIGATFAFTVAPSLLAMKIARLIIGCTGAFSLLVSIKLAYNWLESHHIALAIGVITTIGMFGGVIAQTPLSILVQRYNWHIAIQLVACLGICLVALQSIIISDKPRCFKISDNKEYIKSEKINFWRSLGTIIVNKQNWLSGIYMSLIGIPLPIFGGIWGIPYLTLVHNFSQIEATAITSMIFVGMIIGSPLVGLISDHLGIRKPLPIIGALLSIVIMIVIMFSPTMSLMLEMYLYCALGIAISSQTIGYPIIAESNKRTLTATATSFASFIVVSGNILTPFFGWLLDSHHKAQVTYIYDKADFIRANYLLLISIVISLIAAIMIDETYGKQFNRKS
ncbi:MAG: MFS transporter [Coxiellaceae bacterium]|jgi:MFS family permease|nr:MFS transporter [Coxiellaceae bacterium]